MTKTSMFETEVLGDSSPIITTWKSSPLTEGSASSKADVLCTKKVTNEYLKIFKKQDWCAQVNCPIR